MKASAQEHHISKLITPVIEDLGFELIQVRLLGSQKLQTLQIMAEKPETGLLDLNGCTAISKAVSALLDVEDPIASAYQLEISSPGIDRPLTRFKDFQNWIGFEASIETDHASTEDQKRFRGKIVSTLDSVITILDDNQTEHKIDFATIEKAKLVLTDELLHLHNPKQGKKTLNKKPIKSNKNSTSNTKTKKVRTA
jgi:ribosome maturation factor RimP